MVLIKKHDNTSPHLNIDTIVSIDRNTNIDYYVYETETFCIVIELCIGTLY